MNSNFDFGNFKWIDLEAPDSEELRGLIEKYDLPYEFAHELITESARPRVESADAFVYGVLHFPILMNQKSLTEQELDFILSDKLLITTHYKASSTLEYIKKELEANNINYASPNVLFLNILMRFYQRVEDQVNETEDMLEDIEEAIFEGKEKDMVVALSFVGRDILNLRQALEPHKDILKSIKQEFSFSGSEKEILQSIDNLYYKIMRKVYELKASLQELRETNNSLLSTKQNEVMKIFTILAFVTFPLSLVASLFGMNTKHIPIVGMPYDFWIVIALMSLATIFMFAYFKHKKWL